MAPTAQGTFQVKGWDESTYQHLERDAKLNKVRIDQAYHGGLEAAGPWDAHMYYRTDGTAVYTGIQYLEGTLDGRQGSFVLVSSGEYDGTTASSAWRVVSGSGTEELAGLTGTGTAAAEHGMEGTYTFEYDVE